MAAKKKVQAEETTQANVEQEVTGTEEETKEPKQTRLGLSEALKAAGNVVDYRLAYMRIRNGWDMERAVSTVAGANGKAGSGKSAATYEFNGEQMTLSEISEATGIVRATLVGRLHAGWDPEKAFTTPAGVRKAKTEGEDAEDEDDVDPDEDDWDEDEDEIDEDEDEDVVEEDAETEDVEAW